MAALVRRGLHVIPKIASRVLLAESSVAIRQENATLKRALNPTVPKFLCRHLSTSVDAQTTTSEDAAPSLTGGQKFRQNQIVILLDELDTLAKSKIPVRKTDVIKIVELIEAEGEVSDFQSQLLLGCTGQVQRLENPQNRAVFTKELWDRLLACGFQPKTVHYNALMKSHLENEQPFKPEEILAEMEARSLTPNKTTLTRLLEGYCANGDVQGASQVLENMKMSGYPASETVFNAFIQGHLRAGDAKSAKEMFDVMRSSGINPSQSTCKVFMCGLAEKGDIEAIKQFITDEEAGVEVSANCLMPVIVTLVKHGHKDLVPEIEAQLDRRKMAGYVNSAVAAMAELTTMGHVDNAVKLLQSVGKIPSGPNNIGSEIISAMMNTNRPIEHILEISSKLVSDGYMESELNSLLTAYNTRTPEIALELLKGLEQKGYPIKLHYFLPIIMQFGDQKNEEGIYKTLRTISEMKGKLKLTYEDRRYVVTAHLIPVLLNLNNSVHDIVKNIFESGFIHDGAVNTFLMTRALNSNQIDQAIDLANSCEMFDLRQEVLTIAGALDQAYRSSQDWSSISNILESMNSKSGQLSVNLNGKLLRRIIGRQSSTEVEAILRDCLEKNLVVTVLDGNAISSALSQKGASEEVIKPLVKISLCCDPGVSFVIYSGGTGDRQVCIGCIHFSDNVKIAHDLKCDTETLVQRDKNSYQSMSLQELEELVQKLGEKQNNAMMIELLLKYCQAGETEKATSLKTDLESKQVRIPVTVLRNLGILVLKSGDLQGAHHYLTQIQFEYPGYESYSYFFLNLCTAMVKAGKHEEVLEMLKKLAESNPEALKLERGKMAEKELIGAFIDHTDFKTSEFLFDELMQYGTISKGDADVFTSFVVKYTQKESTEDVVTAFLRMSEKRNRIVALKPTYNYFIKKEDPESLQKIVDLAIAKLGKIDALVSLAESFMESEKKLQAHKVMESVFSIDKGRTLLRKILVNRINYSADRGEIDRVERIIELTKEIPKVQDRTFLLFLLMQAYCKKELMDKAVGVLAVFEEEGILPKPETLMYLAGQLKHRNMEIPFEVPKVPKHVIRTFQENRARLEGSRPQKPAKPEESETQEQ